MEIRECRDEIADPNEEVGYSVVAEDTGEYLTSDIDQAAYLRLNGVALKGTLRRTFRSRGRTKSKIFLVFNREEAMEHVTDWFSEEADGFRQFKTYYRELMGLINDEKDNQ